MLIAQEAPDQEDVRALLAALDAYCAALYPAESNHLLSVDALLASNVSFFVARDAGGAALGCGACVDQGGYAEIKRMYVAPAARGQGAARALMQAIEGVAAARGLTTLRLETGIHQPEAIALYERTGYRRRAPFGAYQADPLSIFMEKTLA